ncbi:MAG: M20 aminoacylase family protein [Pseudomonadota bacterium]
MNACIDHPVARLFTVAEERLLCGHRRWLHRRPEIAFKEFATADYVAAELGRLGLQPERGLAGTGIVATVRGREPGRAVGLRADMDALPVHEMTGLPHASATPGMMHACGHDGHTAILLGAARLLAQDRDFAGIVHLVFQPAEENEGGARVMAEQGLFMRYPMDAIFGLHNWPGLPLGTVAVMPGPMMASFDVFEITLTGAGGHAAMPHRVDDLVMAGSALALALQTIISRRLDPALPGVVSITQVQAGSAWNVLPDRYVLKGSCRAFGKATQDTFEAAMREIAAGIAASHGVQVDLRYERRIPATVNDPDCAALAASCARAVLGESRVRTDVAPSMAGEDFSFLLERCPGAYLWLGIGEDHPPLHSSAYDFEDGVIADGARLMASLALAACRAPAS